MIAIVEPLEFFTPQLSSSVQQFIRVAYGILLLGTLLTTLPQGRRFFMSERWGGYAQSAQDVDIVQNPRVYPIIIAGWLACAVLLILGWWSAWVALVNVIICRYFFVHMRWKGVSRGMGAPGFMSYWLAVAVFLLEYTHQYAPQVRSLALLVLQVDFALIFLSAGVYKLAAGFARNHGMELGMVNPAWGFWWRWYQHMPPGHWVFRIINHLAWSTEVVAAVLMLIPPTRFLGALLIIFSFAFVATQIRLGLLCQMVMLCGVLYFQPGSLGDQWISQIMPAAAPAVQPAITMPSAINQLLTLALCGYLLLLPLAHAGLSYNFYARRALPSLPQRLLERYTNLFGIIVWRVFTINLVNFFVRIYRQARDCERERVLVSRYNNVPGARYSQVGESIVLCCLFTTMKYYPNNPALFHERLLRYARTISCPTDCVLVFEYVSIIKSTRRFEMVPIAEYVVDPVLGAIEERLLSRDVSVSAAHEASPIHEGTRPGSYAPA